MPLIPDSILGKIQFSEAHEDAFSTNHTLLGITPAAVTAWTAKTAAARAAWVVQEAAKLALRDATGNLNLAVGEMSTATSALIQQIRAQAETAGDGVYTLASLPIPPTPSPVPPPGQPTNLKVTLGPIGELNLAWTCVNTRGVGGVSYNIFRRIGATGEFTYVASSGTRKWTDMNVPAGAPLIMYRLQATRTTAAGLWNTFSVFMGTNAGTPPVVTTMAESAARNAA